MSRRLVAPLAGVLLLITAGCRAAKDIAVLTPIAQSIGQTFGLHQVNLGRSSDTLLVRLPDSALVALDQPARADTARAIGRFAVHALPSSYPVRTVAVVFERESKAAGVKITNDDARYTFAASELAGKPAAAN